VTCSSDKLEAGDKLHKAGICNSKHWGDAVNSYREEGWARWGI